MTIGNQKAQSDIRFPDIENIKDVEDVKQFLRAFRKEYETTHREGHRDIKDIYEIELAAASDPVDFDIPLLANVVFTLSGSNGIQWTAGTVRFGGTTFTVNAGNVDPATAVYIDVSSLSDPVTLGTLNGTAAIVADRWYVSNRESTNVYSVLQSTIIHAGLLQANTITATQILANTITAAEINVANLFAENIVVAGEMRSGKSNFSSTTAGWWIGVESAVPKFHIGNSNFFFKWDGSNVEMKTAKGFLGTSTNFFDIDNGIMELTGSFSKMITQGGDLTIEDNSGNLIGELSQGVFRIGDIDGAADFVVNGNIVLYSDGGSAPIDLLVTPSISTIGAFPPDSYTAADNPVFRYDASFTATNNCLLRSFKIEECFIDDNLPSVPVTGHLRMQSGDLRWYTGSAWVISCRNPMTSTGDIIYETGAQPTRLAIGSNGQVLQSNGTVPSWQTPADTGSKFERKNYTGSNSSSDTVRTTFSFSPDAVYVVNTQSTLGRLGVWVFGPSGAVSNRDSNGGDLSTDAIYLNGAELKTKTSAVGVNAAETYMAIAWKS